MMTITDLGYYKIDVTFEHPRWPGATSWYMYLDGLGFYHLTLVPRWETEINLQDILTLEIDKHARP